MSFDSLGLPAALLTAARALGFESVSYTHLRAHET